MRLQIYIPGKTSEDLALREALQGLSGQELKELLALGWQAKNSTTNFPDLSEIYTTKPDTPAATPLSDEVDASTPPVVDAGEYPPLGLGSDQAKNEWEEDVAARRFAAEGLPPRPVSSFPLPQLGQPKEITEDDIQKATAAWKTFTETGELPPDTA